MFWQDKHVNLVIAEATGVVIEKDVARTQNQVVPVMPQVMSSLHQQRRKTTNDQHHRTKAMEATYWHEPERNPAQV